jgi:hypothetical protein
MRSASLLALAALAVSGCSSDPIPTRDHGQAARDQAAPDARDLDAAPDGAPADTGPGPEAAAAREGGAPDTPPALVSCADHAKTAGFKLPLCEVGGNALCKGQGVATSDCDHCCEAPKVPCVVNGHTVPAASCQLLHEIAFQIVPLLAGTRDEKLTAGARVAWWSLKEGILSLQNPYVYSNCNVPPDTPYGPLQTCAAGHAWQVGISGSQVPGTKLTTLEGLCTTLYKQTPAQVLAQAAQKAGLDAATTQKVVASTGTLRNSWLLRAGAIGFTNQAPIVTSECITQSLSWCYSSAWSPSKLYAPTKTAALTSIADLKAIFGSLLP